MGPAGLVSGYSRKRSSASAFMELNCSVSPLLLLAKVVDLDPCLSKKPLEEKPSHPCSARESLSEVQSLSSFQSESCDDNGEHTARRPPPCPRDVTGSCRRTGAPARAQIVSTFRLDKAGDLLA